MIASMVFKPTIEMILEMNGDKIISYETFLTYLTKEHCVITYVILYVGGKPIVSKRSQRYLLISN
jgi:hypothetical protein